MKAMTEEPALGPSLAAGSGPKASTQLEQRELLCPLLQKGREQGRKQGTTQNRSKAELKIGFVSVLNYLTRVFISNQMFLLTFLIFYWKDSISNHCHRNSTDIFKNQPSCVAII